MLLNVGCSVFSKTWTGLNQSGDRLVVTGKYRSLEACEKAVGKAGGGWCGKDCQHYSSDAIADCKPLVSVLKG